MHILPDEDLKSKPIGSAMAYTWTGLSGNWKNSAAIAAILLVLSLFQILPAIGFVAAALQNVLLYAVSYYIVDRVTKSRMIDEFKKSIEESGLYQMLFSFLSPASGFYLGFILFSILVVLATGLVFWLSGGGAILDIIQNRTADDFTTSEQAIVFYAQILGMSTPTLLFFFIVISFFGYLWPLIYGYALLQRSFTDSMNAVFMFFSSRFWKASFSIDYFKIVSVWMLIAFGVMVLMLICAAFALLLPVAILLMLWLTYFSAIVAVQTYNLSDEI